jgi:hypothetical protein
MLVEVKKMVCWLCFWKKKDKKVEKKAEVKKKKK